MALLQGSKELRGKIDFVTPFIVVTSLFFIWGFVTNFNGILVPHLKKACALTDGQTQFINFTFFTAYFLMAIPAGILIKNLGYRKSMILGLAVSSIGTLLFYPAAVERSFPLFLSGLAIMACGITILQVGANIYIILLGKAKWGSTRLSLAGAFNSVGASLAPYIGSLMILDLNYLNNNNYDDWVKTLSPTELELHLKSEANTVLEPYAIIAGMLILTCVLIVLAKIPALRHTFSKKSFDFSVIKRKHVFFGALAIFFYVGAEVGVLVYLNGYAALDAVLGNSNLKLIGLGSVFMMLAMVGRFIGAYILTKVTPRKSLIFVSSAAIICLLSSMLTGGWLSLIFLLSIGLFNSVMWPLIFVLGTRALGKRSIEASSFLVMAIVGGALIPFGITACFELLAGTGMEQWGFTGIIFCYAFLIYFGIKGSRIILSK